MAATAIAARITLPRSSRDATARGSLAFDALGGPLVAICGLAGGAGSSSLALALARYAAVASTVPVLLTEADGARGALALLAGRAAPHPLVELAQRVADDAAPAHCFVELAPRLRLLAATPRRCAAPDRAALEALLDEARAAHGLVVVDHATSWSADNPILARATHTLWTLPATPAGVARARALLAGDVMPAAGRMPEVLVATAMTPRPRVSVRALRRLARARCERLVLIAYSDATVRGERTIDPSTARALSGLAPTLRRRP